MAKDSSVVLRRRMGMFLLGCVPVRLALVWVVMTGLVRGEALRWIGGIGGLMVGVAFWALFLGGWRRTGWETGWERIWWDGLRPVHGTLWLGVAWFAWRGDNRMVWRLLLADVCVGLVAFAIYHGWSRRI